MSEPKKKNFSKFSQRDAYKKLNIRDVIKWDLAFTPMQPSDFFYERLKRLEQFDLTLSEKAKELVIDAVFEEVLVQHSRLKMWKAVPIESADTIGIVDYLLAEKRGYLDCPFLCVIEAKKDDFVQGEAQCLVGMQACQWLNQQANQAIAVYGIVSNGDGWLFYQLTQTGKVFKTPFYSLTNLSDVLGLCQQIFSLCAAQIPIAMSG